MSLYINGHLNHGSAIHSFAVTNRDATGDVVNAHAGWEIVFGDADSSNGIEIDVAGRRHSLAKVSGLLYNGRTEHHEYYQRTNAHLKALVIDEKLIDEVLQPRSSRESADSFDFTSPVLAGTELIRFARSIYEQLRSGLTPLPEQKAITESLIYEIIDSSKHNHEALKRRPDRDILSRMLLKDITSSLYQNIENAEFSLDTLAADLGLSKFHIIRTAKHLSGRTPHATLLALRMRRARSLLESSTQTASKKSIAEIATACGFNDMSSFNKAFRRFHGCTPSAMRLEHKRSK